MIELKSFSAVLVLKLYLRFMNTNDNNTLLSWKEELSAFQKNDPLVHVSNSESIPFEDYYNLEEANIQKIIKQSQNSINNYGINPLSVAIGIVTHIGEQTVNIPYLIADTKYSINKISKTIHVEIVENSEQVNPYLLFLLNKQFDIETTSIDFNNTETLKEQHGIFINNLENKQLGLFHPNRFKLRNECEQIILKKEYSHALREQLELTVLTRNACDYSQHQFSLLDEDQLKVKTQLSKTNTIVEGPPGTGKSQLLIDIIGNSLLMSQKALLFSEKKTALDVLNKRLKELNLNNFLLYIDEKQSLLETYKKLSKQWVKIEEYTPKKTNEPLRSLYEKQIQFKLDIWQQKNIIGEGSWSTFQEIIKEFKNFKKGNYITNPIPLEKLIANRSFIEHIYKLGIHKQIAILSSNIFQSDFASCYDEINSIENKLRSFSLDNVTLAELDLLQKKQITIRLFNHAFAISNQQLLDPQSKKRKDILHWIAKYIELSKINNSNVTEHWKRKPEIEELNYLIKKQNNTHFISRLSFNIRWSKLSTASNKVALELLSKEFALEKKNTQKNVYQQKLIAFGIESTDDAIRFKQQLLTYSEEQWNLFQSIPIGERLSIEQLTFEYSDLKNNLKQYKLNPDSAILDQIVQLIEQRDQIAVNWSACKATSIETLENFGISTDALSYIENHLYTYWTSFRVHYPELAELDHLIFSERVNHFNTLILEEKEYLINRIWTKAQQKFESYHLLLGTPSRRLTKEEQQLKIDLKEGKKLLIKEFNKKRQHTSLHNILKSKARLWIDILHPVHATNPIQLAINIPLDKELYDLCIIEEASQLWSSHAVGALFRSKQLLIAGDDQQMQPSQFFQSELGSESLLERAKYILPSCSLKHHYRSKNTDLISFSNKHFYKNELKVFPNYQKKKAIFYHKIDGQFINRINEKEALAIAKAIERYFLSEKKEKTLGVVAFSQGQVDEIWKNIPSALHYELKLLEEKGTFFLLPIEKIQGDESDNLFIGTTYGRDENGNLRQRFGLLSMHGGRNRLNVLATRASETIEVFSSINSVDIQLSNNENTEIFRKWLIHIEQQAHAHERQEDSNQFVIPLQSKEPFREMVIRSNVLKKRGWDILYK